MIMSSAAIECVAVAAQRFGLHVHNASLARRDERRRCSQRVFYSNRVAVVNLKVGVRRCDRSNSCRSAVLRWGKMSQQKAFENDERPT